MNAPKKALVAVSFGSTVEHALTTIAAVERTLAEACPERDFFRAFTSGMVRRRLAQRGITVSSPEEILESLVREGFTDVILQPTHVIPGSEFDKLAAAADRCRDRFDSLRLGAPLVSDAATLTEIAGVLLEHYGSPEAGTALLFMGHGTEHLANFIFPALQTAFRSLGQNHAYVATVEGWPTLTDAMAQMHRDGIRRVILAPFLLTAGDHVQNDMQGDGEDSWKNILTREGFAVECRCTGLGELPGILQMYRRHLRAID